VKSPFIWDMVRDKILVLRNVIRKSQVADQPVCSDDPDRRDARDALLRLYRFIKTKLNIVTRYWGVFLGVHATAYWTVCQR